ncbi:MAG: DUF5685 family protein [Oscillospiraceae bacterium]|nr:DUF5685 family protein [Oscillospiraceae bacterium]
MFGKVKPFIPQLKMKDYALFNEYYCGLCLSIKYNFGNISRLSLSFDMVFLAILLDSLRDEMNLSKKLYCIMRPVKGTFAKLNSDVLDYCSYLNIYLNYFKIEDDLQDKDKMFSNIYKLIFSKYLKENAWKLDMDYMRDELKVLKSYEKNPDGLDLDSLSMPFSSLIGYISSFYFKGYPFEDTLYKLGFSLGKWIYIIDAYEDLFNDMKYNKFNPICAIFNDSCMTYEELRSFIKNRIEFMLFNLIEDCKNNLSILPLKKNREILSNIVDFGLTDKLSAISRSEIYAKNPL